MNLWSWVVITIMACLILGLFEITHDRVDELEFKFESMSGTLDRVLMDLENITYRLEDIEAKLDDYSSLDE